MSDVDLKYLSAHGNTNQSCHKEIIPLRSINKQKLIVFYVKMSP
jgi:hypothetical protein